jgi:cytidine deaminase
VKFLLAKRLKKEASRDFTLGHLVKHNAVQKNMQYLELDSADFDLVQRAADFLKKRQSEISGVSAGIRTRSGKEYYGVCVDPPNSTMGMCAEHTAIGTMISDGERTIETMVAITCSESYHVLPPCGKCRELAGAFGDPYVILEIEKPAVLKKVRLSELVPHRWI